MHRLITYAVNFFKWILVAGGLRLLALGVSSYGGEAVAKCVNAVMKPGDECETWLGVTSSTTYDQELKSAKTARAP